MRRHSAHQFHIASIVVTVLFLFMGLLASNSVLAAKPPKDPAPVIDIREAFADQESGTLVLVGDISAAPIVTFGNDQIELSNITVTDAVLTTDLPVDLIPGDYLVVVTEGRTTESIMLTIGAVRPMGPPGYSGPLYLNGLLKDANGNVLGFPWYSNHFVSMKGYWFTLYVDYGFYTNVATFFESTDCTGQGYTRVTNLPGQVFLTHVLNEDYVVAYSEIGAEPVTMTTHSLRRFNGSTHGVCETKDSTSPYVPVYLNDPEITGLSSNVGTRDNPFPLPLQIDQ